MAAYDNVSLPGAPAAPSYAAPLLDFKAFGDLGKDYFEGTQMGRTRALQTAFKDGLPKNPDGSVDIRSATDTLAKLGGAESAMPLLNLQIQQQLGQGNAAAIDGNSPSGLAPQSPPVPPHGIPLTSGSGTPQTNGQPAQSYASAGQGDAPNSLMSMVGTAGVPDDKAGFVASTIAKRLGIDPNAPITDPAMKANIGRQLMAAGAGRPMMTQYGNPSVPEPTGPASNMPSGMDAGTADRLDTAAQKLRARASAVGKMDPQGASALEKQAEAYDVRAKQIRETLGKNAEQTPEMKYAAAAGAPNPLDYERSKEQNKDDVTRYGKQLSAIQGSSQAADRMLQHIQLAEAVYKNPDAYTGPGEAINLMYKKIANTLEPGNTSQLPQEIFRKNVAASILNQVEQLKDDTAAVGGGGRLFQQQIALMEKAGNSPDNTIAGNRTLTEIQKRGALASKEIARMANSYKSGHLDSGFAQKVDDYYSKHPMFTQAEINDPRLIAPPISPRLDSQAQAAAWARKAGLKPGDPFKLPSGQIAHAP